MCRGSGAAGRQGSRHSRLIRHVARALEWLRHHPVERLSDWQLKQQGISPERIRRWFQQHYGMTFQAYQRALRINTALQSLQQGQVPPTLRCIAVTIR